MTFDEIRGTTQSLIVAGSETSATALSAALFYLTTNPSTLQELSSEIRKSFQSDDQINFGSTQNLPYLAAVINEALRMHPPVAAGFPREARPGGVMICDYYIPEKVRFSQISPVLSHVGCEWQPSVRTVLTCTLQTTIGISQWAMFRNPRNFAFPNSFRPERWLGDPRFANDHIEAFNPFSYGPRNCIGKK